MKKGLLILIFVSLFSPLCPTEHPITVYIFNLDHNPSEKTGTKDNHVFITYRNKLALTTFADFKNKLKECCGKNPKTLAALDNYVFTYRKNPFSLEHEKIETEDVSIEESVRKSTGDNVLSSPRKQVIPMLYLVPTENVSLGIEINQKEGAKREVLNVNLFDPLSDYIDNLSGINPDIPIIALCFTGKGPRTLESFALNPVPSRPQNEAFLQEVPGDEKVPPPARSRRTTEHRRKITQDNVSFSIADDNDEKSGPGWKAGLGVFALSLAVGTGIYILIRKIKSRGASQRSSLTDDELLQVASMLLKLEQKLDHESFEKQREEILSKYNFDDRERIEKAIEEAKQA